jgi:hypothetical protein
MAAIIVRSRRDLATSRPPFVTSGAPFLAEERLPPGMNLKHRDLMLLLEIPKFPETRIETRIGEKKTALSRRRDSTAERSSDLECAYPLLLFCFSFFFLLYTILHPNGN